MDVTIFVAGWLGGGPGPVGLAEPEFDADEPVVFVASVNGPVGE